MTRGTLSRASKIPREYLDTFDALKSVLPPGDDAPALGIVGAHSQAKDR